MEMICAICGSEFERRDKHQKYCSAECAREAKRETCRQYYAANRERYNEHQRRYYAANREKIAQHQREYRAANREKICERNRKWRLENPDYHRQYWETHRDEIKIQRLRREMAK